MNEERNELNSPSGSVASAKESMELAAKIIAKDTHEWRWHATGAGMGWVCDKCDGHHRYVSDEDPPKYGCSQPQNH